MRNWQNLTHLFDTEEVNEEMRKKYQGSILGIRTKTNNTVYATYDRFRDGYHQFKDFDGGTLKLAPDTDCEVFIAFPEKGLYNTPTGMVYFRRLPWRQYRKGITEENSIATDVMYEIFGHTYNGVMKFVKHILNAQYPDSVDDALAALDKQTAVALNRSFGFSLPVDLDTTHVLVYYLNNVIGFVRDKQIVIKNKVFFQEAVDAQCFGNYQLTLE